MSASLESYRRFFAEEIEAASGLRSAALIEALATVPRERFLGPGPWTVKGAEGSDIYGATRQTPDADPKRVYHNVGIGIDPARQLFNGQPGTISTWIEQLGIERGCRVLHIGAGTGYYTAIMAQCVGPSGRVVAYEADEGLAGRARANLSDSAQVEIRHGDATSVDGVFDAVLVNAGATHPLDSWLRALGPSGRLVVPITFAFSGTSIAKGIVALLTRRAEELDARLIGFVAIFAAVGVRDASLNERIGTALKSNPMPRLTAMRRDVHELSESCWLHDERFCLQAAPIAKR